MIFRPEGNSLTCCWVLYDLIPCKRTFNGFCAVGPQGSFGTASKVENSPMRVGPRAFRIHDSLERLMEIAGASHPLFSSVVGLWEVRVVGLSE